MPRAPSGATTDPRRRRADVRRDQILDAALGLFAVSGSRGTSIAAVAAEVGISDAGVLHHFRTKAELLVAALERFDHLVEHHLVQSRSQGMDYLRFAREWGAGMEAVPEVSALLITLSAENLTVDSPARRVIQARYRRILDRLIAAFATAARQGDLRADLDPVQEASALLAHVDGIRMQWFLLDGTVSMAASVRTYLDGVFERLAPVPVNGVT